jgi:hypothetical protein
MRKIALISGLSLLLLTGCKPSTKQVNQDFVIPAGLHDCTFFDMQRDGGSRVLVVRCPNSDVTAGTRKTCGKGCVRTENATTTEGNQIRDNPYGQ